MFCGNANSKRYQLILLPQAQNRFNSLKTCNSNYHKNNSKRHSLDSRPVQNIRKNHFLENAQENSFTNKFKGYSKRHLQVGLKGAQEGTDRAKYYWKGKPQKARASEYICNRKQAKRTWSEFGKIIDRKQKKKEQMKEKYDHSAKVNTSDRLQTKLDITLGKSSLSCIYRKEPTSGDKSRVAKSLLNSTMLTKRLSEQPVGKIQKKYQEIIVKLRDVLIKYEKKVKQLSQQKQYYKIKLRKQKRRIL